MERLPTHGSQEEKRDGKVPRAGICFKGNNDLTSSNQTPEYHHLPIALQTGNQAFNAHVFRGYFRSKL
jgi:hypothetical protein